jgi:hypothetical protein
MLAGSCLLAWVPALRRTAEEALHRVRDTECTARGLPILARLRGLAGSEGTLSF